MTKSRFTLIILILVTSWGLAVQAGSNDGPSTTAFIDQSSFQNDTSQPALTAAAAETTVPVNGYDPNYSSTADLKTGGLCACGGRFRVGDRVVAAVDNPSSATGILTGHTGTVGCGSATIAPPIYIGWDDWTGGHNSLENCDCPEGWVFNDDAGYFVDCDEIKPIVNPSAQSVCGGSYWAGSRVRAIVDNPEGASGIFIGREGRVVCAKDDPTNPPLLVDWDGWSQGHQQSSYCDDPATSAPIDINPNWWVQCNEVESASEAGCVCGGYFAEGGRVSAAVDNPANATDILKGHMGTVICGQTADNRPLISWDGWTLGHNGNALCECPVTSLSDNSGWYTGCEFISKEHGYVFGDGFYTGDVGNWD